MAKRRKQAPGKIKPSGQPSLNGNLSKYLLGIFLLGALLYANTLGHQYTQDDAIMIYDNMYTTQGVKAIPGLLTKDSHT